MQRRRWFRTAARLALGGAGAAAWLQAEAQPLYKISARQLQQALAQHFPLRYPVGGWLDLSLQAPRLRLLPALNRLGTDMGMEAAGVLLPRRYSGSCELDFGLRYEASDQSVRAHRLRVHSVRFADLPPAPAQLLNDYAAPLAEQTLQDLVLYRLRPQDLMLADGLGLQPGSITVTAQGLVIGFVPKALR
jgi:hypothetical protein